MSGQITFARPVSDYRADDGPVLCWRFPLTGELPYVGTPFDADFIKPFTHYSKIPIPHLVPTR